MKASMMKYAGNTLGLDATYKVSDYTLPLFFLIVKSPVQYVIVGMFIVQFETSKSISEAQQIVQGMVPQCLP